MLSDTEMTIEEAAKELDLTPPQLSVLMNKGVLPSRMHIGPDGKRSKLLPIEAVRALRGTGAYKLLVKEPTKAPAPAPPKPQAPPTPTPAPAATPPPAPATPAAPKQPAAPAEPPTTEPPVEAPQSADALQVALLQSLSSTQERVAAIERRLESLMGSIATDLAVKLAALPSKEEARGSANAVTSEVKSAIGGLSAEVKSLTEALSSASVVQSQTAQKHTQELAQVRSDLADARAALTAHAETTDAKLSDLFQVLEALPEILESQGSKLGQLVEWSADEQEKSPLRQIQKLGRLIGDRRRGTSEDGSTEGEDK